MILSRPRVYRFCALILAAPVFMAPLITRAEVPQFQIDSDALQLRDPFKRPASVMDSSLVPTSELEQYSVDQFKMVGVITGADRLRAIVLDPKGKTHFVSEKMRLGTRRGVIREIRADKVTVREKILNAIGKEESVDVEIKLPAEGLQQGPR